MAIALDSTSNSTVGTGTRTWNHTVSGSDTLLIVTVYENDTVDHQTTCTFNGVGMTEVPNSFGSNVALIGLRTCYYLANPASGTHSIVWTNSGANGTLGFGISYTGVNQVSPIDASVRNNVTGQTASPFTNSLTTVADNCWMLYVVENGNTSGPTASTNTTLRKASANWAANRSAFVGDSNGPITPAGSFSMTVTGSGGTNQHYTLFSIAPVPPVVTTVSNLSILNAG